MVDNIAKYYDSVTEILNDCVATQSDKINEAAKLIYESQINGGRFWATGTGHSHMVAEEFYARAGGLGNVQIILPPEFMLHENPIKSTLVERTCEYKDVIDGLYDVKPGDVVLISSNSGRNNLIVELALMWKERGVKIIGLTNIKNQTDITSRHKSNLKLGDIADIAIDNCGKHGDAGYQLNETFLMGSTSTITGAFIAQALSISIAQLYLDNQTQPPVFKSSNLDDGDEWNKKLFQENYNIK